MAMWMSACGGPEVSTGPIRVLQPETSTLPTTALDASRSECDDEVNLALVSREESALQMLKVAAELAAATDAACGPPGDLARQCRALFFISSTEPTLVWAEDGDWRDSLAVWQFAVDDGQASSSPDLALMWAQLREFTNGLRDDLEADREAQIANRVVARADAVSDLAILQDVCAAS